MGRSVGLATSKLGAFLATKVVPAGYMGEFGTGIWSTFYTSGTYTVPSGIYKLRVRVVGAGGYSGGSGGGYAHKIVSVMPGQVIPVLVGLGGKAGSQTGGTSSFGAFLSATGGAPLGGTPGSGSGGDFNASGGTGGGTGAGGGGAGSQLGKGGNAGVAALSGGGGVNGGNSSASLSGGGSAFGSSVDQAGAPDVTGMSATSFGSDFSGDKNRISAVIRFPFDGFVGGGGACTNTAGVGGSGAGGAGWASGSACKGGVGGGGGGGGGGAGAGNGGIGGGGGGGANTQEGGPGLVVVEW